MKKLTITLALTLLVAVPVTAQQSIDQEAPSQAQKVEVDRSNDLAPIAIPTISAADGLEAPALTGELAASEYSQAADQADAAAEPFTRGSFWWYVGIIVVAGIILAIAL